MLKSRGLILNLGLGNVKANTINIAHIKSGKELLENNPLEQGLI